MHKMICSAVLAIGVASLSMAQEASDDPGATVVHPRGWVEHARLMPFGLLMEAKLDSGARTTSIHAEILPPEMSSDAVPDMAAPDLLSEEESDATARIVSMMGDDGIAPDDPPEAEVIPIPPSAMSGLIPETITFKVLNETGKDIVLTRPVTRWVSIRRRGGGAITRPVVILDLCIGGRRVEGEVNLADRTGFNYPLLIGRNMLGDAGITVDSRKIHVSPTACPTAS